jgi:hypothetical protein
MKREEIIEILRKVNEEVKTKFKGEIKGIFGSFAKGEESKESDIDILVEFESEADLIHFVGLSLFLEEKLGQRVDVVPYDTIRPEIKENILKESIYL